MAYYSLDSDDAYVSLMRPRPQQRKHEPLSTFKLKTGVLDDGESVSISSRTSTPATIASVSLSRYSSYSPSSPPPTRPFPSIDSFASFPSLPPELRLKIWSHAMFNRTIVAAVVQNDPRNPQKARDEWDEILFQRQRPRSPRGPCRHYCWGEGQNATRKQRVEVGRQRQVPAILQICRESRLVALQHYRMAFSWKPPPTINTPHHQHTSSPAPAQAQHALTRLGLSANTQHKIRPGRIFFSCAHDTLLLSGDLEPWDQDTGLSHPAAYFFVAQEAARVRSLAVRLGSLRIDLLEAHDVATVLFHVVDRFTELESGKLEVWVNRAEEEEVLGVSEHDFNGPEDGGGRTRREVRGKDWGGDNNVVMKIWKAAMGMHAAESSAAGRMRIYMISVDD